MADTDLDGDPGQWTAEQVRSWLRDGVRSWHMPAEAWQAFWPVRFAVDQHLEGQFQRWFAGLSTPAQGRIRAAVAECIPLWQRRFSSFSDLDVLVKLAALLGVDQAILPMRQFLVGGFLENPRTEEEDRLFHRMVWALDAFAGLPEAKSLSSDLLLAKTTPKTAVPLLFIGLARSVPESKLPERLPRWLEILHRSLATSEPADVQSFARNFTARMGAGWFARNLQHFIYHDESCAFFLRELFAREGSALRLRQASDPQGAVDWLLCSADSRSDTDHPVAIPDPPNDSLFQDRLRAFARTDGANRTDPITENVSSIVADRSGISVEKRVSAVKAFSLLRSSLSSPHAIH